MGRWRKRFKRVAAIALSAMMLGNTIELPALTVHAAEQSGQAELKGMCITDFAGLEEAVKNQQLAIGTSGEDISFPDTLTVTIVQNVGEADGADTVSARTDIEEVSVKEIVLTDITWELNPAESDKKVFDSSEEYEGYCYVYTPVLPEKDAEGNALVLGEDVEIPAIYVVIGSGEDHVNPIAEDGYDEEGFCEAYEWVNGVITQKADTTCSHDNCNGYQPAVETTEKYDIDGDGNNDTVYEISNAGQLYWFAAKVNGGDTSINGRLTEDIIVNKNVLKDDGTLNGDGSNFRIWTPIGFYSKENSVVAINSYYIGVFDGDSHMVSGLYFNNDEKEYVGLFGRTKTAIIRNIGVVDFYFSGYNGVGSLVGRVKSGKIEMLNCYGYGTVIGKGSDIGGVLGNVTVTDKTKISDCYSVGSVDGSGAVGGVIGNCKSSSEMMISNCYHEGAVNGVSYIGGVVGYAYTFGSSELFLIENCYSTGTLHGNNEISGVIGRLYVENGAETLIENCYNTGMVNGNSEVGGVFGYVYGDSDENKLTFSNCMNSGKVTSTSGSVGGIIGKNEVFVSCILTISNCYYLSGCAKDGNGIEQFGIGNSTKGSTTPDVEGQTIGKTEAQFQSGEVTYLLNGERSEGTDSNPLIWYQTCGEGLPSFSGQTVYYGYLTCHEDKAPYNNEKTGYTKRPDHQWVYTGSDATITVNCTKCSKSGTFTLTAPNDDALQYDGTAKEAKVEGKITGIEPPEISYFAADSQPLENAPVNAGTYTASISMTNTNGNPAEASITYTIAKATPVFEEANIPTISGICGQKLSEMILSNETGSNQIAGTWNITENNAETIYPEVDDETAYQITFIPEDTDNYESYTTTVVPKVKHDWEYTGSGVTITVKCPKCSKSGIFKLVTPNDDVLQYDGTAKEAKVEGEIAGIETPVISYFGTDSQPLDNAPVNVGTYTASISVTDTDGKPVEASITYTIAKATPVFDKANIPTISGIYGQKLSEMILSKTSDTNSNEIKGTWSITEEDAETIYPVVDGETAYQITFTPEDINNYESYTATVVPKVEKAENAPNMPKAEQQVASSCKTVGMVELPENWEWQEDYRETPLIIGEEVKATAEYVGNDNGNYENETVEITIIRQVCTEHTDTDKDGVCDDCDTQIAYRISITSRLSGSTGTDSVANLTMNPSNGYVVIGNKVTVTAPDMLGYTFKGWYLEANLIDKDTENPTIKIDEKEAKSTSFAYTFTPNENVSLIAVYEAAGQANVTITGSNFKVSVSDGDTSVNQDGTYNRQHNLGSEVTIVVTDENFINWRNENQLIVTTQKTYTFILTGNVTLNMSKRGTSGETAMVEFVSEYNQVIASQQYGTTDTITFPGGPTKMGYIFEKWNLTQEEIQQKIKDEETHIKVTPVYTQDESRKYKVTVYVNEEKDEKQSVTDVLAGSTKTVKAPAVEGKVFLYWTDAAGVILGYDTSYFMQINKDVEIYAVYGEEAVAEKPVIAMTNVFTTTVNDKNKISFTVTRDIPDGYTLIEHGMLYNTKGTITSPDENSFILGGSGVNKYVSSDVCSSGVFTLNINATNHLADKIVVRGYMIVEDSNGKEEIYYTNIVHTSYDETQNKEENEKGEHENE